MTHLIGLRPQDIDALNRGFRVWNEQMVEAINGVIVACGGIAPDIDEGKRRLTHLLAAIDTGIAQSVSAPTRDRVRRWRGYGIRASANEYAKGDVLMDNQELRNAISRLKVLKFDVIVSTETKQDAAVCAVLDTAVPYRNPHYPHERGWSEARDIAEISGNAIQNDVQLVCAELEEILAAANAMNDQFVDTVKMVNDQFTDVDNMVSGANLHDE